MTAYPAWTPASRPGIVPLHPYGFGTILGRSFTALRQNPRVLLGFALVVQAAGSILTIVGTAAVAFATFSRLDTVRANTDEFEAVFAGSVALTALTGIVLSVASGVLTTLVQGVVVAEVAHAVVAEKAPLRTVWRRVRPSAWRLIGWAALSVLAVGVVVGLVALVFLGAAVVGPGFLLLLIPLVLALIPLGLWLAAKLFLVPAAIVLEGAGVFGAVARSWRLTRTRFWPTLGVIVIITVAFGAIGQVISVPLGFASGIVSSILSPSGETNVTAVVTLLLTQLLGQVLVTLVQCIALVVQATAAGLTYVDARMRHEGLDQDLIAYVEARDAGGTGLPDPYRAGIGRTAPVRPMPGAATPVAPTAYPPAAMAPSPPSATSYAPAPPTATPFAPAAAPAAAPAYPPPTGPAGVPTAPAAAPATPPSSAFPPPSGSPVAPASSPAPGPPSAETPPAPAPPAATRWAPPGDGAS